MTIITIIPTLIAFAGALVYVLAANPKLAELGRIAFAVGLLVAVYVLSGHVVRIG